jgi:hypothetical protein
VAKTRKSAKKSSTKKAPSVRKAAGGKKKAKKAKRAYSPKELDLRPFKKQLKAHVEKLSASKSTDPRVQDALASLRQAQAVLADSCGTTMTIPLE